MHFSWTCYGCKTIGWCLLLLVVIATGTVRHGDSNNHKIHSSDLSNDTNKNDHSHSNQSIHNISNIGNDGNPQDNNTDYNGTINEDIDGEMSAEKRVIQMLLERYNRVGMMGRPVRNTSHYVTVYFGLGLIQLDLNEKDKVLTMSMWTRYSWRDEYLVWDPAQYEGVTSVRLNPDLIWRPDIMLYNTAQIDKTSRDALAVITADGGVMWYPHSIFYSSCAVDVSNFPFDSQQCHMWFGSWTHPSHEVDLQFIHPQGIDLSTFQSDHKESCGWDIVNVTARRQVMPSEEEVPNFIVLTFDLDMKRKLVFSTYILTLPCVFLACLTLVVFWLPPERPDRTALAMSTFASFMVLLLILVEAAPPTASSIPTLGLYYSFNMVIIMLAIVLSSLVVNTSRGGSRDVPRWLLFLTNNILIRGLCITPLVLPPKPKKSKEREKPKFASKNQYVPPKNTKQDEALNTVNNYTNEYSSFVNGVPPAHAHPSTSVSVETHAPPDPETVNSIIRTVKDIHKTLRRIEVAVEDGGLERVTSEMYTNYHVWRHVSLVLDRFFFLVYVILIIVSLSVLFPKPSLSSAVYN